MADDLFEQWMAAPYTVYVLDGSPTSRQMSDNSDWNGSSQFQRPRTHKKSAVQSTPCSVTNGTDIRTRRRHTKSRLGCVTCKKRRVKCPEERPACSNCIKRGSICQYPTMFKHSLLAPDARGAGGVLRPPVSSYGMPSTYSATDLRLFHHFLITAHPCIPHAHETVWVRDIPVSCHQYEYLMHAILATSGSHIAIMTDDALQSTALFHRQKAIAGLEEAFTRWPPEAEEAHVTLATSYLLAFQSTYIPDGFLDHILSLRGCSLISQLIASQRLEGVFSVGSTMQNGIIEQKLSAFPVLDQQLVTDGLQSLENAARLFNASEQHGIEKALFVQLVEIFRPLLVPTQGQTDAQIPTVDPTELGPFTPSPKTVFTPMPNPMFPAEPDSSFGGLSPGKLTGFADIPPNHHFAPHRAFSALMSTLLILSTWPQGEAITLFQPANQLGHVVMAHFFAIRFIIAPLTVPDSALRTPLTPMISWFERVLDAIEDDDVIKWTDFVQWPAQVLRTLRLCVDQKRGLTFGDIYHLLVADSTAFRDGRPRVHRR